jgi:hypothetical protein
VLPVDQVNRLVRLPGGDLNRHAVAQQLVGAQVGLIERDSSGVRRGFQLLQRGGDVGVGVAALLEVRSQYCACSSRRGGGSRGSRAAPGR